MLPSEDENGEFENHPGRTSFPDLRPIPGDTYDPSILPPATYSPTKANPRGYGDGEARGQPGTTPTTASPTPATAQQPTASPSTPAEEQKKQAAPSAGGKPTSTPVIPTTLPTIPAPKTDDKPQQLPTGLTAKQTWDQEKATLSDTWKKDSGKAEDVKAKAAEATQLAKEKMAAPSELPEGAVVASTVCVENKAGFTLKWQLQNAKTDEKSKFTGTYPISESKCMDIKEFMPNVKDGDIIKTIVDAKWGDTNEAEHTTVYKADANAKTTFKCTGTTLNFKCKDAGTEPMEQSDKKVVLPTPS